jgi:hypothetical protein
VVRLAEQLQVDPDVIRSYGRRAKTRTDHLLLVARYLRSAGELELKELDEFLPARAMEHDSPTSLFRPACEYLISARVIRPGPGHGGQAGRTRSGGSAAGDVRAGWRTSSLRQPARVKRLSLRTS